MIVKKPEPDHQTEKIPRLNADSWSKRISHLYNLIDHSSFRPKAVSLLVNGILIFLLLYLYRGVYPYLGVIFTRQEFRTNQIVLLGVVILIIIQVRKGDLRPQLFTPPQLYIPALALVVVGSIFYILSERYLDVNTVSASLFGLACYGLIGLWMRPRDWRQGLPAALILIGSLPFGEHLQTFVGYPVRVLTAAIVRDGLAVAGIQMVGVDTILIFENSVSKIDLPCSGIKSLWTGGLFLLAATWVERRTINRRWFLVALFFTITLLVANLARVAILVLVGQVAGWRLLAEMLHVPLGVLGFVVACLAAAVLLRWSGTTWAGVGDRNVITSSWPSRPGWLVPLLGGIFLIMALIYTPRPEIVAAHSDSSWRFPTELDVDPWPLTSDEEDWLNRSEFQGVDRWRFQWRDQSGSMLFITSSTWRAHHRPERCFEVYGLDVDNSYTQMISPDFPVRLLSLGIDGRENLLTAAYWLQSANRTTDDYATRIWSDLAPKRQKWVLVTVLFDEAIDPESSDILNLFEDLQRIVHSNLVGGY